MINKYADDLAAQIGIKLSKVTLTEGRPLGCLDAFILCLDSNGKIVNTFIHKSDLDCLQNGFCCDRLELRIRSALARLKMMLEPHIFPLHTGNQ